MKLKIIDTIEHEPSLLVAGAELQRYIRRIERRYPRFSSAMRGEWLGHPLHPIMTDMAIGGYTVAWALDLGWGLSDKQLTALQKRLNAAADYSIAIGLVGSVLCVMTGPFDWARTKGSARTIGLVHMATNAVGTAIYLGSWLSRKRASKARFWLSMLGTVVITAGAYLGGYMVYRQGVGVTMSEDLALRQADV
jgi:uncharacterized membrane protein